MGGGEGGQVSLGGCWSLFMFLVAQGVMANSVRVSFSNDNHHHETLTLEDTNIRHLCGK